MLKKLMYALQHIRREFTRRTRGNERERKKERERERERKKERERERKALITRNGRIFISERRTESSRRAQKNKTIDKKNCEMRKTTVEIIGGTEERASCYYRSHRCHGGARGQRALLRNGITGGVV